jgi:hypothetical protein
MPTTKQGTTKGTRRTPAAKRARPPQEGAMLEGFRSRLGEARQDWDWLVNQAEEMARVVQEQQVRLEEMDLLVRQRDGQLAEQQTHVEELEATLRQRDQEVEDLRARLAEREEAYSQQGKELEELRAQLARHEAAAAGLRDELAQAQAAQAAVPKEVTLPAQAFLERLAALEDMVRRQGESLAALRPLIQEEMARLHRRIDRLEAALAAAPARVAAPVAPAVVPAVAAVAPPPERLPVAPAVAAPPLKVARGESPLQDLLCEALDSLPAASLIGLAGLDGMGVELVARTERPRQAPLEVELADLAVDASRIASALGTGPLLTLAFQSGAEHYMVSPVGEGYFAFLLLPDEAFGEFRHAQAVLLQAASRLNDLF